MKWGHPDRIKVILLRGDLLLVVLCAALPSALSGIARPILETDVPLGAISLAMLPQTVSVSYVLAAVFFGIVFIGFEYVLELYDISNFRETYALLSRLFVVSTASMLVWASILYLADLRPAGAGIPLSVAVLPLAIYIWRIVFVRSSEVFQLAVPTLVLGEGERANIVRDILAGDNTHTFVDSLPLQGEIEGFASLEEFVFSKSVRSVVITSDALPAAVGPAITEWKFNGVNVLHPAELAMSLEERLPLSLLNDSWLWFARGFDLLQSRFSRRIKRLTDLLLSSFGLVVAAPLAALIALAIKLDSRGPVFFRQVRVGWMGRSFEVVKFRSMSVNAERDGKPQWAQENDVRVTRVGRWLRRTHLDEIPQLWNILRGEMSFVGPRPERPEFVRDLRRDIPLFHLRHYVLPGLTGWAQVRYPYGASTEDSMRKLEFDLYYIVNASLLLDFRILLKTVLVVLYRKGSR